MTHADNKYLTFVSKQNKDITDSIKETAGRTDRGEFHVNPDKFDFHESYNHNRDEALPSLDLEETLTFGNKVGRTDRSSS